MGSLRNPVGPLPSSIYWRRRAVALVLLALLVLLIAWAVRFGDTGGKTGDDGKPGGANPAPSITPGPSGSGPAISEQPGGRDESGDSGDSDGTGGDDAGTGTDTGGTEGGKNGDPGASGAAGDGGTGAAEQVPASSSLPVCAPGAVKLTVRSVKAAYGPGQNPQFELAAHNASSVACKADFGPKTAVLTVSAISDGKNEKAWSSKDCPSAGGTLFLKVPAGRTVTHSVDWDRRKSSPQCATPPAAPAAPGSYLLEATFPGTSVVPASFRLERD